MRVSDMQCHSCEERLQREIGKLAGIVSVRADYREKSLAVAFDPRVRTREDIETAVKQAGYTVGKAGTGSVAGIVLIFAAIALGGMYAGGGHLASMLQSPVSYAMLFVVGLLTSLHCVGMCGGLQLSQTLTGDKTDGRRVWKPAVLYNLGRLCSYTAVGAVVGALGSALAFTLSFKAGVTTFAGIFMVLMGLGLIGFRAPLPLPAALKHLCAKGLGDRGPFAVGLLNGLLPCGPLQMVQVYALGTGSALAGATAMFLFALGTVPLMLPLGLASGWVSRNYSGRILQFSGVLVIVLGLMVAGRGVAIAGIGVPAVGGMRQHTAQAQPVAAGVQGDEATAGTRPAMTAGKAAIDNGVQVVRMAATNRGYEPSTLVVQKGIPLKWVVDGQAVNSCNNEIIVPSLNIQKKLQPGENVIEFTPGNADIPFSCWMGMIKGVIRVVDDLGTADAAKAGEQAAPQSTGAGSHGHHH